MEKQTPWGYVLGGKGGGAFSDGPGVGGVGREEPLPPFHRRGACGSGAGAPEVALSHQRALPPPRLCCLRHSPRPLPHAAIWPCTTSLSLPRQQRHMGFKEFLTRELH